MVSQRLPFVVVGGGFYGCAIAAYLAENGAKSILVEAESDLLLRASYTNQARLHGGYHYPRSFSTAYRSRLNFARFMSEFRPAIDDNFQMLYAIGRGRSHISARQFREFSRNIEAPCREARASYSALFNPNLIEAVFEVEEFAFNVAELRKQLRKRLNDYGVEVRTDMRVISVVATPERLIVQTERDSIQAGQIYNCTYSGLNRISGIAHTGFRLKHEIAEMALVEPPDQLKGIGVTVMDGPFFSFMPFPDRSLYTFSHVRYTPHAEIADITARDADPYAALKSYPAESRYEYMWRDAARYMSLAAEFQYRESLFEVKTVMIKNEEDDGRPILFSVADDPRVVSVLGSKIDNIYDALTAVGARAFEHTAA